VVLRGYWTKAKRTNYWMKLLALFFGPAIASALLIQHVFLTAAGVQMGPTEEAKARREFAESSALSGHEDLRWLR
jgi:hypothetical protein